MPLYWSSQEQGMVAYRLVDASWVGLVENTGVQEFSVLSSDPIGAIEQTFTTQVAAMAAIETAYNAADGDEASFPPAPSPWGD